MSESEWSVEFGKHPDTGEGLTIEEFGERLKRYAERHPEHSVEQAARVIRSGWDAEQSALAELERDRD